MLCHEVGVVVVVYHHLRHVVESVGYAVVEDDSHARSGKAAVGLKVVLVAAHAHDESVYHELLHHLQTLALAVGVFVRLGYHHLLVVLVEHALYARHHLRGVGRVHLGHDDADGVRATHLQVHGYGVAAIAEALCLAQHSLAGLAAYVLVVGESARHRRHRDAELAGYVFYSYVFHYA